MSKNNNRKFRKPNKYKRAKTPAQVRGVAFEEVIEKSNQKRRLFTTAQGQRGTDYYFIMPNFFKSNRTEEFIYWDSERQEVIRTGLKTGDVQSESDLRQWESEYHEDIEDGVPIRNS